jgi:hypothetical protein
MIGATTVGDVNVPKPPKNSETADGHIQILYPNSFRQAGREAIWPREMRPDYMNES